MARQPDIILVEQWKEIPSWPGYKVSTHGRISGPRGLRKSFVMNHGYVVVPKNGSGSVLVHRAVAEAFLGPCPPGMQVHHRNGKRDDNRLTNLEYASVIANNRAKYAHGTIPYGVRNAMAKLSEEQVREVRKRFDAGEICRTIAEDFGISATQVRNLGTRQHWPHVV